MNNVRIALAAASAAGAIALAVSLWRTSPLAAISGATAILALATLQILTARYMRAESRQRWRLRAELERRFTALENQPWDESELGGGKPRLNDYKHHALILHRIENLERLLGVEPQAGRHTGRKGS